MPSLYPKYSSECFNIAYTLMFMAVLLQAAACCGCTTNGHARRIFASRDWCCLRSDNLAVATAVGVSVLVSICVRTLLLCPLFAFTCTGMRCTASAPTLTHSSECVDGWRLHVCVRVCQSVRLVFMIRFDLKISSLFRPSRNWRLGTVFHVLLATTTSLLQVTPPSIDFFIIICLLPQSAADVWLRPRPSAKQCQQHTRPHDRLCCICVSSSNLPHGCLLSSLLDQNIPSGSD